MLEVFLHGIMLLFHIILQMNFFFHELRSFDASKLGGSVIRVIHGLKGLAKLGLLSRVRLMVLSPNNWFAFDVRQVHGDHCRPQ
jgi:hypothetical protein